MQLWKQYAAIADQQTAKEKVRLSFRAAQHLYRLLNAGMDEVTAVQIALVNKYIMNPDAHAAARMHASLGADDAFA